MNTFRQAWTRGSDTFKSAGMENLRRKVTAIRHSFTTFRRTKCIVEVVSIEKILLETPGTSYPVIY